MESRATQSRTAVKPAPGAIWTWLAQVAGVNELLGGTGWAWMPV